jgi:two-component system, sensor histidine kinase YesM
MFNFFRSNISKIDDAIIKWVRTLSVKVRFFMMVIIISITPIFVIGVISYTKSNTDIISKTKIYSLQTVKQFSLTIDTKFSEWERYGNIIADSEDVQAALEDYDEMKPVDQNIASKNLQKTMKEVLKVSLDIQEPDIITNDGGVISTSNFSTTNTSPFVNNLSGVDEIKEKSKAAKGSFVWDTGDIIKKNTAGFIVLARSITEIKTLNNSLGYLMLRIDSNYLYNLYNNANLGNGSKIYLLDNNFTSVLSGNKSEVGTKFSSEISEIIQNKYSEGYKEGTFNSNNSKCLVAFSNIPTSGFTVVALIPNKYFNNLSNDIGKLVIQVGVICLIVSILFFTIIYRSITVPLNQLMGSMRGVKKGSLKVRKVSEDAKDEVGEVASSYNEMINELNLHIENIKEKEKQKALVEFRALQAQINPHFIANTLNSVAWMARMQKAENIENVVTSLNQLLNASMGKGNDIISIGEELQNLKSYISIQNIKYLKSLDVNFDMDEDILDCKLLRFLMQPLVENAIIHGLAPKQGQGSISIKGYRDHNDIVLMVTDNGVGMNEDEIKELLIGKQESKDSFSGIGLKNVNERIKLTYGNDYGLLIKSQKGMFTTIELKLPVIL